ncbi:hypothetical protein EVAR_95855_1 [Eumeta japonica]|uniref:Uncharacterized protein n=1 Tax=Eumeta variegata TaxID=151549 RepID=A0A4C1VLA2_EUMVA|nr:hypothetical protein EVAR_95855_1 [Eumeta japonica]
MVTGDSRPILYQREGHEDPAYQSEIRDYRRVWLSEKNGLSAQMKAFHQAHRFESLEGGELGEDAGGTSAVWTQCALGDTGVIGLCKSHRIIVHGYISFKPLRLFEIYRFSSAMVSSDARRSAFDVRQSPTRLQVN